MLSSFILTILFSFYPIRHCFCNFVGVQKWMKFRGVYAQRMLDKSLLIAWRTWNAVWKIDFYIFSIWLFFFYFLLRCALSRWLSFSYLFLSISLCLAATFRMVPNVNKKKRKNQQQTPIHHTDHSILLYAWLWNMRFVMVFDKSLNEKKKIENKKRKVNGKSSNANAFCSLLAIAIRLYNNALKFILCISLLFPTEIETTLTFPKVNIYENSEFLRRYHRKQIGKSFMSWKP